jgi:hypothetical protein
MQAHRTPRPGRGMRGAALAVASLMLLVLAAGTVPGLTRTVQARLLGVSTPDLLRTDCRQKLSVTDELRWEEPAGGGVPPEPVLERTVRVEATEECTVRGRRPVSECDDQPASPPAHPRRPGLALVFALTTLTTLLIGGLVSAEAGAAVIWRLDPVADSTVAPGTDFTYHVQMTDVGDSAVDASSVPITFTVELPTGFTVVSVSDPLNVGLPPFLRPFFAWDCSTMRPGDSTFSCTNSAWPRDPLDFLTLAVRVHAADDAAGALVSRFTVSGGDPLTGDPGNPTTTIVDPTTVTASAPSFGVDAFDGHVDADAAGNPLTQAGAHPYSISTAIDFNTNTDPLPLRGDAWPVEPTKDISVDLPPGLVGDPTGVAQCTLAQLANAAGTEVLSLCPPTSQVGVTFVHSIVGVVSLPESATTLGPIPVFNMVPPPGVPARFAFDVAGAIVTLDARVRSEGDYGLSVDAKNIPEGLAVAGTTLTFWGVPADPSHDSQRACPGRDPPTASNTATCPSGAPRTAFLRNPTSCTPDGVGLPTTMRLDSWFNPGDFRTASFISHLPPGYPSLPSDWGPAQGPTGCDRVPFLPGIDVRPLTPAAGQPSQFSVDVSLPQSDDPNTIDESDLKTAVVALPAGVRVNPASASGLAGCTPAQIGLHSLGEPSCPDGSKIGSVRIITPLLRDPLTGSVYLASPHDNPFGTLLGIYIVAEGSGVTVKLAGRVDADPITGQLTTTVDGNPQTPFNDVILTLDGGARAPLTMPNQCADYTTTTTMVGWNGAVQHPSSRFTISQDGKGAPCGAPTFSPTFAAGTESSSAATSSPFHVRIARGDSDQELSTVTVDMPSGLTGRIASVPLCGSADATAGTCGDASKIGSVSVGAGAGANPFYITNGRAYLTGPYKGAPFGLSIVVPAVAGPFDLGNVVVRSALFVDKHTADVRIVSDPLPRILQGITLQVRDVRVDVNRPGFIINPTSCANKTIDATIGSTGGMTTNVSDRYQAAECRSLSFAPRMVLSVGGTGHTARNRTTPLSTTLTMPPNGQANIRSVQVTLPDTINARLTVINDACTRQQFETDIRACDHAKAGTATAVTPLLRDPLRGSVYFVKTGRPGFPNLIVALRGQVAFDLIGQITIPHSRFLRTTFPTAPDVPIKSFTLRLFGDNKNGSVGAAANLCSTASRRHKAQLRYIGQNGRVINISQALVVHGCVKHKARRHHRRG